jgi:hypothetical protein
MVTGLAPPRIINGQLVENITEFYINLNREKNLDYQEL